MIYTNRALFQRKTEQVSPSTASRMFLAAAPRLASIDVFRGATIAAMILVNSQFPHEASFHPLVHAAWNGWTFADTIFPCFLFIVGASLTLSTTSRFARGEDYKSLMAHAAGRALLLFVSGVVIEYLRIPSRTFPFIGLGGHLQLSGALQKISICYLLAFLIYLWTGLRGVIVGIVGLNLLYLGFLYLFPVPGCGSGSLTISCNFPGYVDEIVLGGFRWDNAAFDPDGVGAILPATTSVLFGVLAGQLLVQDDQQPRQRLLWLLSGGLALIAAGELLSAWVPFNKQLWTTSFAVLMAGLAAMGLAFAIWLVDDRRAMPHWLRPMEILGLNAIAAYLISRLVVNVPKSHVHGKSLHDDLLVPIASPATASLVFAMIVLAAVFVVIWLMDRRGWHLKL